MPKSNAVKKVDVESILEGAAILAESKPSKSKIPILTVSDAIKKLAKRKKEIVDKLSTLQAEDEIVSADIIAGVKEPYGAICAKVYTSSVKIPTEDDSLITLTWKSAYKKIATDKATDIKEVVGENYDRWFNKVNEITVKDTSPEFLTKLINLVGKEKFAEFFEVVQTIVPNATFTEEKWRLLSSEKRGQLDQVVEQYKPSFRAK